MSSCAAAISPIPASLMRSQASSPASASRPWQTFGGFPFPICTPAHGTAYDIAGQGIASIGASRAALLLAAEMAARRAA
jgi:isocitrate/isopropylmalate dehydrogenase